jgi:hypothetical protein
MYVTAFIAIKFTTFPKYPVYLLCLSRFHYLFKGLGVVGRFKREKSSIFYELILGREILIAMLDVPRLLVRRNEEM